MDDWRRQLLDKYHQQAAEACIPRFRLGTASNGSDGYSSTNVAVPGAVDVFGNPVSAEHVGMGAGAMGSAIEPGAPLIILSGAGRETIIGPGVQRAGGGA